MKYVARRRPDALARCLVTFAILGLLCGAVIAMQSVPPTEVEGVWIGDRQEMEGQVRRLSDGEIRLSFQGAKLLAVGLVGAKETELSFTLDTNSSPRRLTYRLPAGTTRTMIYKVDGDTLTLASEMPGRPLPETFSSQVGAGALVTILKKRK